jgi:hypothetical protein
MARTDLRKVSSSRRSCGLLVSSGDRASGKYGGDELSVEPFVASDWPHFSQRGSYAGIAPQHRSGSITAGGEQPDQDDDAVTGD